MTPKEFAIECFRSLCDRVPGGVASIADATGLSAESLTQVLKGTKLPSGKPRGLGPNSIDAITAQYPGWMDLGSGELTAGRAQSGPSLDQCLGVVARVVASASKIQRRQLAALLESLASAPEDRADTCAAIMGLLAPGTPYVYTETWEESARRLAVEVAAQQVAIAPDAFIRFVDEARGLGEGGKLAPVPQQKAA